MNNQIISIIVALNQQNVIGQNNQLPWHISEDLKYFKQNTLGKPVIMGRKTFESIGRPLPNRTNIVITRDARYQRDGIVCYRDLFKAIESQKDAEEICIIGGGEIFKLALPLVNKLYLTIIDYPVSGEGIVTFPQIDLNQWQNIYQEDILSSSGIKCSFNQYLKRK